LFFETLGSLTIYLSCFEMNFAEDEVPSDQEIIDVS